MSGKKGLIPSHVKKKEFTHPNLEHKKMLYEGKLKRKKLRRKWYVNNATNKSNLTREIIKAILFLIAL